MTATTYQFVVLDRWGNELDEGFWKAYGADQARKDIAEDYGVVPVQVSVLSTQDKGANFLRGDSTK